jgi:TRAP-type C4-dicarboxylate transport system permease small subunit
VSLITAKLPPQWQRASEVVSELLMALFAAFTVVWGARLVDTTWYNSIAEFPFMSVGVTYLPIPIGGAITFLFVIERLVLGLPRTGWMVDEEPVEFD